MKKVSILSITFIGTFFSFNFLHAAQKPSIQTYKPLIQSSKNNRLMKVHSLAKNNKTEKLVHERTQKPIKIKEIEKIEFK